MRTATHNRRGYTLIELAVAMASGSVLMIGLSSAVVIALRCSDVSSMPAPSTLTGSQRLTDMQTELQFALTLTEATSTAITATVPDRNGDAAAETIRYAWSGTTGGSLTRQLNSGTVYTLAENIYDFNIQYYPNSTHPEYLTVRLQINSNSSASIQAAIPMLNRP